MKRAWRYLAVGVAVYLLVMVVTFPAGYISNAMQDRLPGLELGNVSGSVFSGRSGQARFSGFDLGAVEWQFRPLALLLLRVEYRLTFSHPDNSGHVIIGTKPGSDVYGQGLDMKLVPDLLLNRFSPVALSTRGRLALLLDHFEFTAEGVRAVTGTVSWQDAAVVSPLELPLGEVELTLASRDTTLVADVTRGGELGVSGEILLQPGNRYALDLVLRPGGNVSSETQALLDAAMDPHPGGGYQLKTSGSLQ